MSDDHDARFPEVQATFTADGYDEARSMLAADLQTGLRVAFAVEPSSLELRNDLPGDGPITNGVTTAYAWRVTATPRAEYWGTLSDPIDIHGTTFVVDGDEPQLARYIDWHSVFVDLGVAAAGRVVNDPADS